MTEVRFRIRTEEGSEVPVDLPVEIRKPNMALVRRALTSHSVKLEPGSYFVSSRLPTGQEAVSQVRLDPAEERVTVELTAEEPIAFYPGEPSLRKAIVRTALHESDLYSRSERLLTIWNTDIKALESRRSESIKANLRFWRGNVLGGQYPTQFQRVDYPYSLGNGIAGFEIRAFEGPVLAQLLQPDQPPVNVMLPAVLSSNCALLLVPLPDGRVTADVQVMHAQADLLLGYLTEGSLEEAQVIATAQTRDAEEMLREKLLDPVAAAIGAYALLRWGELERLHDWTENLRRLFGVFPDGSAIRGEHLARVGQHQRALTSFLELRNRGIPLFGDGLEYAVDRLRLYVAYGDEGTFGQERLEQAQEALDQLQQFIAHASSDRFVTAYTGLDPTVPNNEPLRDYERVADGLDIGQLFTGSGRDRTYHEMTSEEFQVSGRNAAALLRVGSMPTVRLSGAQYKRLSEAILESYGPDQLEELLLFDLDKRIQDMVYEAASYRDTVRQVIAIAQQEGWLLSFIEATHKNKSIDPNLRNLYRELQAEDAMDQHPQLVDPYEVRFLRQDRPFVDRNILRQALRRLVEGKSRILVVDGQPRSGRTYSGQLIKYVLEKKLVYYRAAWIDLSYLAQAGGGEPVSATDIGEAIAAQWGLTGMPEPAKEQEARWVRRFCAWLSAELDGSDTDYWAMIDNFDKEFLQQGAHDLIDALSARVYTTLPMLRLVLLGYKNSNRLRSIVVGGDIEVEFISYIGEEDLIAYFALEYADRWTKGEIPYNETDLKEAAKESAVRVLRQVDANSAGRWEELRLNVTAEARRIAEQVGQ